MFVIRIFLCQMIQDVFSDCNKIEVSFAVISLPLFDFLKMVWCSLLSLISSRQPNNIHLNHACSSPNYFSQADGVTELNLDLKKKPLIKSEKG